MSEQKSYIFGPVPSRRLGLSLGVDIVPFKSCSQDCVYCQLGQADCPQTIERKSFVPIDDVITELKAKLEQGVKADYITLSGSGEPTLNSDIEEFIDRIRSITDIKIAIITNGTLLNIKAVRDGCKKADLIVPSLDAVDQKTFEAINRPHKDLVFENLVDGLVAFRSEYSGDYWLEIFIIDNVNTSNEHIEKFKKLVEKINPDKVQINTAVRPTAKAGLVPVKAEKLKEIAEKIGEKAEVIIDFKRLDDFRNEIESANQKILDMLKRRPCSLEDICAGLNVRRNFAIKHIEVLMADKKIATEVISEKTYYSVPIE